MRWLLWIAVVVVGCAEPDGPEPDAPWSFAILPDTQILALDHPEIFDAQTQWLADQAGNGLLFVLHVGDITHNNDDIEWDRAESSIRRMDGRVPYVLLPGNHDYGERGMAGDRTTQLGDRWPVEEWESHATFGGSQLPDRPDSTYHVFETPDGPWLVLALEFAPTEDTVTWAVDVLERHSSMPAILVTHAYLYFDDTRYDDDLYPDQMWSPGSYGLAAAEEVYDGQELYEVLVEPHANVRFVFCGHTLDDGLARISTRRDDGTYVHELLANYQNQENGGNGYLRVIEMHGEEVEVRTYSPHLDRSRHDPDNEFFLPLRD